MRPGAGPFLFSRRAEGQQVGYFEINNTNSATGPPSFENNAIGHLLCSSFTSITQKITTNEKSKSRMAAGHDSRIPARV